MKIALLTDGVYPYVIGGMQKHSHYLAHFLALAGNELTLVHCITGNEELPQDDEVRVALNIGDLQSFTQKALRFPKSDGLPGHYIRSSYAYSVAVYRYLKIELDQFDLVYAKGFSAWELLNRKRKGLKTPPVAVKFHGYEMFQHIPGLRNRFARMLLQGPVKFNNRHADYVFSYGGKITEIVKSLGVPSEKIVEIPTGIAAAWCSDNVEIHDRSERHFVFVGRYERRKGIEELTAVLKEQDRKHPFHFHFVGPVPHSKRIGDERITYHGTIKDSKEMQDVLDQCDVLVTPSYAEGMPNVIMEGMARGLAVIATDVGAVSAQVDDQNGWLIEAADAGALKMAFEAALHSDNEGLLAKRQASLQRVKAHFTWEAVAGKTIQEFEHIGRRK